MKKKTDAVGMLVEIPRLAKERFSAATRLSGETMKSALAKLMEQYADTILRKGAQKK